MSDSFTETSSTSWGSNLFGSIKSVLFGMVLFVISFPLLFWNEGRAVRTSKGLTEGQGAVVSVPADSVDASKEGKLIHVSGAVKTDAPVADDELAVQATAVKLIRTVEMYQWKEHEKSESRSKVGGGTETVKTWEYKQEWAEGRIDSSGFKHAEGHENPEAPALATKTFVANQVNVGAFTMSQAQIGQLTNATSLPVDAAAAEKLPADARDKFKVKDGKFYEGDDPAAPKVGDVRISFQVVNPASVSLIGVQTGQTFAPYSTATGTSILLVEEGTLTAPQMFKKAQDANTFMTWLIRLGGFFLMFLGIFMLFRPIVVFADVLPLFGTMLGAGIGLFAFLGAAILSFLTIATAWVFYRPVIGILMLVLAGAAFYWLLSVGMKKKAARAAALAPSTAMA
ncbi:MAG TPA: TMEM43 family protein [Thermoanaerobaculia bacterium]|nr:TMEM43 family protein [Thermoanaerobaculia bacterium]